MDFFANKLTIPIMKHPLRFLFVLLLTVTCSPFMGKAQEKEKKEHPFGISFSGFVNCDVFLDSRQTVNSRDGEFLFYPENRNPDALGNDINAKASYNILSIQTRVTGTITGPDVLKAKSSAVIEGEFFGNINPNINTFRLRLAYMKFSWSTRELLLGQFWHPMSFAPCFPEVVALNTGAPFIVFSRNPQVRFTQDIGNFKVIFAAISQLDMTSTGPEGASTRYLRNSVLPELDLQVQYAAKNEAKGLEFLAGASVDFLMLTPRLYTTVTMSPAFDTVINNIVLHQDAVTLNYKTNEKANAWAGNIFARLKIPKFTFRAGAVYGGNTYAFCMLGGYAVKSVTDPEKGFVDYSAIRTASVWADVKTNGKRWETGIFGGYSKNLGAGTEITGPYYSRGSDIRYLYRVSPRVTLRINKFKFGTELDYTAAGYGKTTPDGTVANATEVGNLRILLASFYYF
jgi:hypothetical protein